MSRRSARRINLLWAPRVGTRQESGNCIAEPPMIYPVVYRFSGAQVRHGANLHGIMDNEIGVLFASHNLEHYFDPVILCVANLAS